MSDAYLGGQASYDRHAGWGNPTRTPLPVPRGTLRSDERDPRDGEGIPS